MPRDDSDERKLSILLSAVSSVLRGTGAIASIKSAEQFHAWDKDSDTIVEVTIAVSKVNQADVEAVRAAVTGYSPTKATVDRMQKEIDELRKAPDHQEIAALRADLNAIRFRATALDRQVIAAEARSAPVAAAVRIANLESEIVNLRKQLNVAPPVEQDDRDAFAIRASLLELD